MKGDHDRLIKVTVFNCLCLVMCLDYRTTEQLWRFTSVLPGGACNRDSYLYVHVSIRVLLVGSVGKLVW